MRGRKPKPTAIRKLEGNPGKRTFNADEPEFEATLPSAPDHLSKRAKKEWARAGKLLLDANVLTEADYAVFAVYCQQWSRWVEAERAIAETGTLVKTPNGYAVESPLVAIAGKAMERMMKAALGRASSLCRIVDLTLTTGPV